VNCECNVTILEQTDGRPKFRELHFIGTSCLQ